jgi:hypothetical protein
MWPGIMEQTWCCPSNSPSGCNAPGAPPPTVKCYKTSTSFSSGICAGRSASYSICAVSQIRADQRASRANGSDIFKCEAAAAYVCSLVKAKTVSVRVCRLRMLHVSCRIFSEPCLWVDRRSTPTSAWSQTSAPRLQSTSSTLGAARSLNATLIAIARHSLRISVAIKPFSSVATKWPPSTTSGAAASTSRRWPP